MIKNLIDSFLAGPVLAGQLRHVISTLAGILVGVGAVQPDNKNAFISIMMGIVMWLIAAAWSWIEKNGVVWLLAEKTRLEKLAAIYSKQLSAAKAPGMEPLNASTSAQQPPAPSVGVKQ